MTESLLHNHDDDEIEMTHTCPKKPCDSKIALSISSLKHSKSAGKDSGMFILKAQVETVGKNPVSTNFMEGQRALYPRGGIVLQPVRNTNTSSRVGVALTSCAEGKLTQNNYCVLHHSRRNI